MLFIGIQLFVSFAAAIWLSIRSGIVLFSNEHRTGGNSACSAGSRRLDPQCGLLTLISNALTLLLLLPVFAARKKSYAREISLFPLAPGAIWPLVLGATALSIVISLLLALLPIPEALMDSYTEASSSLDAPGFITALSTVIFAPIAEEVIFRGLVYTRLRRAMPVALACVLSSLVFAILHGELIWIAYCVYDGRCAHARI